MTRRPHARGFTLIEMMVTVAIIGILAAAAGLSFARDRPRASLSSATAELQSVLHGARQQALSTGRNVAVLVFPQFVNPLGGTGRVIVYEDGNFTFFNGAAPLHFESYDPAVLAADTRSQVVTSFDLPRNVAFGPATGMGAAATLPAPLAAVDVRHDCSFCGVLAGHRGAILFDGRGRASFRDSNAPPAPVMGASLSLWGGAELPGQRTLVVTPATGAVRALDNG